MRHTYATKHVHSLHVAHITFVADACAAGCVGIWARHDLQRRRTSSRSAAIRSLVVFERVGDMCVDMVHDIRTQQLQKQQKDRRQLGLETLGLMRFVL